LCEWDKVDDQRGAELGTLARSRQPTEYFRKDEKMSILSKLASAQGRKDEEPNKELAKELVANNDIDGIREAAENFCGTRTSEFKRTVFLYWSKLACWSRS